MILSVYSLINSVMLKETFLKLGMYNMAPEPISTTYFTNPSHQSVYLYGHSPAVASQRIRKIYHGKEYTRNNRIMD
jgi:hypothetical protein